MPIIVSHLRAEKCGIKIIRLLQKELSVLGVHADVIQIIEEQSLELTNMLMKQIDAVVATGGRGMMTAAYSSEKLSLGVDRGLCRLFWTGVLALPMISRTVLAVANLITVSSVPRKRRLLYPRIGLYNT